MSDAGKLAVVLLLVLASAEISAGDEIGDPTRPSYLQAERAPTTNAVPRWNVASIIVSSGRRIAVVNDRVVGVNDWVGGARVREILPYEVQLEYKGEIRHVSLVSTRVKNPTTER